jgi:hypothetical protein
MPEKRIFWSATLVLAAGLFAPGAGRAESPSPCPGSSYSPCHYNFPLAWRLCAHVRSYWHSEPEAPPPFSQNVYEYRSHCPYVEPAALLGFPSLTQRSKLAAKP